jgi:hypothetical protein
MSIGMALGVKFISANDAGNYGTTVLYFITICDIMPRTLRQIITA